MRSRNPTSKEPSFVVSKVVSARPKHRLIRNTMVTLFIVGFKSTPSKDNLSSRLSLPFWVIRICLNIIYEIILFPG